MNECEAYRNKARQHLALAKAASDQATKDDHLKSAGVWERLAERAEPRKPSDVDLKRDESQGE